MNPISKLKDLCGQKFGLLTVICRVDSHIGRDGRSRVKWLCECNCGNTVEVYSNNLTSGKTRSCGCIRSQRLSNRQRTHGYSQTRLYGIWQQMKNRCNNANVTYYNRYGGRGINVCSEWISDFDAFRNWSMANGYTEELSIDRIDNNKDYCPENCRWVSMATQASNRSSNRLIEYDGETHTVTEWAKILDINAKTLFNRIYSGWSIEKAFNKQ